MVINDFIDINLISFIVVILYIWFDTDAFVEWSSLFRLKFLVDKFKEKRKSLPYLLMFPDYLITEYPNFITSLLNCPFCFCVWISIISTLVFGFSISHLPNNIIISSCLYVLFKKILKYE